MGGEGGLRARKQWVENPEIQTPKKKKIKIQAIAKYSLRGGNEGMHRRDIL
jgi:hypothetical protein